MSEFVVVSHLEVADGSQEILERAFADRLGEVEGHDGFLRLEVWRATSTPGQYSMVTWWRDATAFQTYLRSDRHRRSHARIPAPPHKPRGVGLSRYEVVAR
jgi:heme-degrading monooxygenase HmoA